MSSFLLSGVLGALKGNREAKTGEGMQPLGNGFNTWNPGNPGKKLEGTVGGFVEGMIGGTDGQGKGGLMGFQQEQKENKQFARLFDQSSDLMKGQGLIDPDVDVDSLSVNDKSEMMRGGMQKLKLMQGLEGLEGQRKRNDRPNLMSSPGGVYDVDAGQIIEGTQPRRNVANPMFMYKSGDPLMGRKDGLIGKANPKTGLYEFSRPRLVKGVTGAETLEDISHLPELGGVSLMGGAHGTKVQPVENPEPQPVDETPLLSLVDFIEDFKKDTGKEPSAQQIAAAKDKYWR